MLSGIGVDIASVARVEKAARRGRFVERIFTESERELFASKNGSAQTIAGNFAAKEALIKALGHGIDMREAAVLRESSGRPFFVFTGALAAEMAGKTALVSISHEKEYAVAMAAIENGGENG